MDNISVVLEKYALGDNTRSATGLPVVDDDCGRGSRQG